MQDAKGVRRELVETAAEALLAERAGVPGLGRLRLLAEGVDEPAEPGVLLADPSFPVLLAAFDSRRAEPPGVPGSIGSSTVGTSATDSSWPRQRTVFVDRS